MSNWIHVCRTRESWAGNEALGVISIQMVAEVVASWRIYRIGKNRDQSRISFLYSVEYQCLRRERREPEKESLQSQE